MKSAEKRPSANICEYMQMTIKQAKIALRELRNKCNDAVAYYVREGKEELPNTSAINELLNAGYVVRIPYKQYTQSV